MMISSQTHALSNVARVIAEHRNNFIIRADDTEFTATVRGSLHRDGDFPKVGDYVEYVETAPGQAVVLCIRPRRTQIVRDATNRRSKSAVQKQQIIVTNVDVMFIVMGLDKDFSTKRLERYLLLAHQSNIAPVVVLNKADMVADTSSIAAEVAAVAGNAPVYFVSAHTGAGMDALPQCIKAETTVVLLGSSGAGKSTITNWFLGDSIRTTRAVRDDDSRGMHTTTSRELFALPHGGFLIDTPGMRELGMVAAAPVDAEVYAEITALSLSCKYPDCDHEKSEGCAILAALDKGNIDPELFRGYQKLQKEQHHNLLKTDHASYVEHKQNMKRRHKEYKKILKRKNSSDGFMSE